MHHVHEPELSDIYNFFPEVEFVTISDFQRNRENLPRVRTIHHGIDLSLYRSHNPKQEYLAFLGRIAPIKGTHLGDRDREEVGYSIEDCRRGAAHLSRIF